MVWHTVIRSGFMVMSGEEQLTVTGKVKWFNQFKGYGFLEVENISKDVFLHFSVIEQSGIEKLNNEDVIVCEIEKTERGYQVTNIMEVIYLNKYETGDSQPKKVTAVMKWFNPAKGFGFAQISSGEDVFIHSNLLKKNRIETIAYGERVILTIHHTNLGYEALDITKEDEIEKK